jgi:ribonuclease HI
MPEFTCSSCGDAFSVPQATLDRYPGWTPQVCLHCRDEQRGAAKPAASRRRTRSAAGAGELLTLAEVLEKYHDGPSTGVFTDGSSHPNPGPGGWGAVYVVDGTVVAEAHGDDRDTTNNRMELTALRAGCDLVPAGTAAVLYTDSNLAVRTVNEWAAGWEARGWRRKTGPVENVDLVRDLYETLRRRPELSVEWVPAHSGYRWNEYADALSTAYRRDVL